MWIFHIPFSRIPENPEKFYAAMQSAIHEISTVSTWFSTEKALILLVKTRLCGKLDVEILMHTEFSTCGSVVEKLYLFVENSRKKL